MGKDFDTWNGIKKILNRKAKNPHVYPREVWWCALGLNIGAEIDGKNENFERPVLVLRVYNTRTMLIAPITSTEKNDPFHCRIGSKQGNSWVSLTQTRVIGIERFIRRVRALSEEEFGIVRKSLKPYL